LRGKRAGVVAGLRQPGQWHMVLGACVPWGQPVDDGKSTIGLSWCLVGWGWGKTNDTIWRVCDLFFVFIDSFSQQPSISCKLADCWFLSWGLEARGLGIVCAPCLSAGS
jgi:hypothetical protein